MIIIIEAYHCVQTITDYTREQLRRQATPRHERSPSRAPSSAEVLVHGRVEVRQQLPVEASGVVGDPGHQVGSCDEPGDVALAAQGVSWWGTRGRKLAREEGEA